jgi:hypothetical protein
MILGAIESSGGARNLVQRGQFFFKIFFYNEKKTNVKQKLIKNIKYYN